MPSDGEHYQLSVSEYILARKENHIQNGQEVYLGEDVDSDCNLEPYRKRKRIWTAMIRWNTINIKNDSEAKRILQIKLRINVRLKVIFIENGRCLKK